MHARVLILAAVILTACAPASRREVERASAASDPASLSLQPGYNAYVRRTILADLTETGIISCRDGSSSRYWFRSHHLADDDGCTLFRFSDGTEDFMAGWFCCEVQLPEEQFASLAGLKAYIQEKDGISP